MTVSVIDRYLKAHSKYVEVLEAIDAIGNLVRDVGEQLLGSPLNVSVENGEVRVANPANRRDDMTAASTAWPTPEEIRHLIDRFAAAKLALVAEGEALMAEKAPEKLKQALAARG